ncbi:MAG: hypothetical protein HYV09_23050, partial [Deltaproteobacteria bacterium]|nr:hypothetical protein [Deltaproteobacteria bacterium]
MSTASAHPGATSPRPALLRVAFLLALIGVVTALGVGGARYARATALLLGLSGTEASWATLVTTDFAVETAEIAGEVSGAQGTVRARVYRPIGVIERPRGMVLAHGVHWLGIDEPRLVGLARAFARAGVTVVTPELAPLADYRVDAEGNLDALRASVRWLARDPGVKAGGVGLVGVSFAGGLAQRVAAEPAVADDLAFVASIGGHHDMPRVARFFVTDRVATPEGDVDWRAHDYGLAVLVYNAPERFVPAEDAPQLRVAVRAFLRESYRQAELESLALSPPARAVFDRILHRDRMALAATVLRELPSMAKTMQAASPAGRLASVRVPLFLLHGAHDDVVPPSESRFSAAEATGSRAVHLLVSSKIGHAELGKDESRF